MAPHSSTLAWKIPWMEEPGGLPSVGSHRVRHNFTFTFTFHFHALEKEMATHSSILAWRIPGTVEPGGLPSVGSHRVGHNWSDLAAAAARYRDSSWTWECNIPSRLFFSIPNFEFADKMVPPPPPRIRMLCGWVVFSVCLRQLFLGRHLQSSPFLSKWFSLGIKRNIWRDGTRW